MKLIWNRQAAAWDALAAHATGRTFTHGAAWLAAAARACHGTWGVAIAEFSSSALAFVPVVVPGREGFGPRLAFSGVLGGYGGLLATEPLTAAQVDAVYRAVRREHPDLCVRGNPRGAAPHGPSPEMGFQRAVRETRVAHLSELPAPQAMPAEDEFWWVAGPQEFQADMFGRLEAGPSQRPRAFYYHLFGEAPADRLTLAVLRRHDVTIAAALVGHEGDWAYLLGAHALCGDPAPLKRLVSQLPGRLGPAMTHLDLGCDFPTAALPGGWATVARPVTSYRRLSMATQMYASLRPVPLEAT